MYFRSQGQGRRRLLPPVSCTSGLKDRAEGVYCLQFLVLPVSRTGQKAFTASSFLYFRSQGQGRRRLLPPVSCTSGLKDRAEGVYCLQFLVLPVSRTGQKANPESQVTKQLLFNLSDSICTCYTGSVRFHADDMTTWKAQIDCHSASKPYRGNFIIEETKADIVTC